jgi:hypothetical protein
MFGFQAQREKFHPAAARGASPAATAISDCAVALALLPLANLGKAGKPETMIPGISQETMAEIVVGTGFRILKVQADNEAFGTAHQRSMWYW